MSKYSEGNHYKDAEFGYVKWVKKNHIKKLGLSTLALVGSIIYDCIMGELGATVIATILFVGINALVAYTWSGYVKTADRWEAVFGKGKDK